MPLAFQQRGTDPACWCSLNLNQSFAFGASLSIARPGPLLVLISVVPRKKTVRKIGNHLTRPHLICYSVEMVS